MPLFLNAQYNRGFGIEIFSDLNDFCKHLDNFKSGYQETLKDIIPTPTIHNSIYNNYTEKIEEENEDLPMEIVNDTKEITEATNNDKIIIDDTMNKNNKIESSKHESNTQSNQKKKKNVNKNQIKKSKKINFR